MSLSGALRGILGYIPSWTQSCGGNPSLNSILNTIDGNTNKPIVWIAASNTPADQLSFALHCKDTRK